MTWRSNPLLGGALAIALFATCARPAHASTTFPEALRSKLELQEIAGPAPGCRLCHQSDVGGLKTATQPLARSLIKAGATASSVPALLAALATLEEQATDSDQDGTPDIEELRAGSDPNVASAGGGGGAPPSLAEAVPLPETGCALAGPQSSLPYGWVSLAFVVLWRARRSRRNG